MSRTVLLLGATGVVGTAILDKLGGYDVIAAGNTRIPEGDRAIQFDLTKPCGGMDNEAYTELYSEIDVVVNAAGNASFVDSKEQMDVVNVEGMERVLELAAAADAPLIHISTAFVSNFGPDTLEAIQTPKLIPRPDEYVASKHASEELIRKSDVDGVIVRPSVVVGDSETGVIHEPQAIHMLAEFLLTGRFPFIPAHNEALIDIVPQDVLGDAVKALVDNDVRSGEYWLTSGPRAMKITRFAELLLETGAKAGLQSHPVRVVDPTIVDRLIQPVFAESLPARDVKWMNAAVGAVDMVTSLEPLDTSLEAIAGGPQMTVESIETAWRNTIQRLIDDKQLAATA